MRGTSATARAALTAMALALAISGVRAWVDVKVDFDKAFDFKAVKTWAWNPGGHGQVFMARTQEDDAEVARKRVEPLIIEAVTDEIGRRGLQQASATPDVMVTYYLLLSNSASSQTVGQFLPGTTAWALPPFAQSTQSLEIMNQGSLVLDFSAAGKVVWRGVAQARIKMDADDPKREALLREAVRDLVRRVPKK